MVLVVVFITYAVPAFDWRAKYTTNMQGTTGGRTLHLDEGIVTLRKPRRVKHPPRLGQRLAGQAAVQIRRAAPALGWNGKGSEGMHQCNVSKNFLLQSVIRRFLDTGSFRN